MNKKTGCLGNQQAKQKLPKHLVSPKGVLKVLDLFKVSKAAIQEVAIQEAAILHKIK